MMNGSHRGPAKTRTPSTDAPASSFTANDNDVPVRVVHVPLWTASWPFSDETGRSNTQSMTNSGAPTVSEPGSPSPGRVTGRSRNR